MQNAEESGSAAERMTAEVTGLDLRGRTVLIASNGAAAAQAAAHVGAELERDYAAVPAVLHVFDLTAYPVPPLLVEAIGAADQMLGDNVHEEQRLEIASKLTATVPEAAHWPIHIVAGTPAVQIVRYAEQLHAAVTLIGLRAHGRIDRIAGDETTLRVQRHATSPVLAVPEATRGLARRIIVGVDFSRASVAAAHAALDVAAAGATLTLVHVIGPGEPAVADEEQAVVRELGVASALSHIQKFLRHKIGDARGAVIDTHVMSGRPSELLLNFADSENADLIAIASRRHGLVARLMLGSVADELTRAARRALLLVPPAAQAAT